ncbi:MAG: M48 family metalloprotease [Alphaproteobacteria bacterium]|nr:M48 family metalloprotease [Alphaproteobacteria bacterium]
MSMTRRFRLRLRIAVFFCVLFLTAQGSAFAQGMSVVRDEEIEQILRAFGTPVFFQAGVSPAAVRFVLVEDDALNAFVAGGQNIFLHTGLLLKSENAAEVAGVIAHETGHIALGHLFRLRHEMEDLTVQSMLASLLGIAVAIGARDGKAGAAVSSAGQNLAIRKALRHSRTQESAADQAGIRFLKEARLPLSGFLSFMKQLENQELLPETQQSAYVQTHPLTRDRVDVLSRAAENDTGHMPPSWPARHARMKAKLLGYLYPDRALADKSDTKDAQYAHAIAWYRKGHTAKAVAGVDALLEKEPSNPYFHELKAQILFESGDVRRAVPSYARAVELAPGSGLIRAAYGHALLETAGEDRGLLQKAVTQLERAAGVEPQMATLHHLLAIGYGKLKKDGLFRLHLAEKYVLVGKMDLAREEAQLALAALPKGTPARLRAEDILDITVKKSEK